MEMCGALTLTRVLSCGIRADLNSPIVDGPAGLPRLVTDSIPEEPGISERGFKAVSQIYNLWELPGWLNRRARQRQTSAHRTLPPAEPFSGCLTKVDKGLLLSGSIAEPDRRPEGLWPSSSSLSDASGNKECDPLRPPDHRPLRHYLGRVAMATAKCLSLLAAWLAVLVILNTHYLRSLKHQSMGKNNNNP